jgi:hypothetical protein
LPNSPLDIARFQALRFDRCPEVAVFRLFLALMIVLGLIGPGPAVATGQDLVWATLSSGDTPASDPPITPALFASPAASAPPALVPSTGTFPGPAAWPGSTRARFAWPSQTAPPAWNSVTR